MTTNILFLSDLHLEHGGFPFNFEDNVDLVLLGGDISTKAKYLADLPEELFQGIPIVGILGNHDYYYHRLDEAVQAVKDNNQKHKDLHILENEVFIFNNIRILGCTLWSDFRLLSGDDLEKTKLHASICVGDRYGKRVLDFYSIKVAKRNFAKVRPLDLSILCRKSEKWLDEELSRPFDGTTIVMTHHAPSLLCVPEKDKEDIFSCAYASHLDWLIEKHQPDMWLHGHIHNAVPSFQIGKTKILSNPRGYFNENELNPNFNPGLVLNIEDNLVFQETKFKLS